MGSEYAGRSIPSATGFRTTSLISIGACVAALVLAAFIPMKYERSVAVAARAGVDEPARTPS